jgi:hypothetical protein
MKSILLAWLGLVCIVRGETNGPPTLGSAPPPTIATLATFSEADDAYAADVRNDDLVNSGQVSLTSFTSSVQPTFGAGGQNDGTYGLANVSAAAYYHAGASLPATLTFTLNTAAHPEGYRISAIHTFAGWKAGGTQTHANQKYLVEYLPVGGSDWLLLKNVDYSPFTALANTPANTKVSLTESSGAIVTAVAALRFILAVPTESAGANNGTVLQEIDVIGQPLGPTIDSLSIASPTSRHIVQRSAANLGDIALSGTYTGTPNTIEARVVVMAGAANSGTTTHWQTIVPAPAAGTFTGTLVGVPAGGWYQLEVRTITNGYPATPSAVDKIGVGDIYITAGQSNAANFGSPAYTPRDDRLSVRTSITAASWCLAADPMPVTDGGGGSVWSRLADALAAADNLPIGFLCVAVGATQSGRWLPGASLYDTRLKPAVQSFPAGGFRAILWHQGESDSIANISTNTHAARLASIIAQSRLDAGWRLPWYIAEAAFHPVTDLSQEEPVAAGQRAAAAADPLVFLGPSTDGFHLENASGGKLADSVHFNAAGLADHANQWRDILRQTTTTTPRNGGFEDNRSAAITGLSPLADGACHSVNISTHNASPSVLGWRILTADGLSAAAGSNGFFNPAAGTYAGAADTINNGVLPAMAGRHVAFLDGGSAGNCFLHTTRATALPNMTYSLTVAIGLRDNPATFGNARLDVLADGQVVATATFTKAALDSLRGGSAAGSFTDVTLHYLTGDAVAPGQALALRIAKVGGASTVLDFDNVRFTATPSGIKPQ